MSGFLRSGRFSVIVATPSLERPLEVLRAVAGERPAVAGGERRVEAGDVGGGHVASASLGFSLLEQVHAQRAELRVELAHGVGVEAGEQLEDPALVLLGHRREVCAGPSA